MELNLKPILWVGSSLDDLKKLPKFVQREIGFALHQIQEGYTPDNTKPLKNIGSGVYEIISDYDRNTYRAVYAVKIGGNIYVLHVFQKKSKRGIGIPKEHQELIIRRLKIAKRNSVE